MIQVATAPEVGAKPARPKTIKNQLSRHHPKSYSGMMHNSLTKEDCGLLKTHKTATQAINYAMRVAQRFERMQAVVAEQKAAEMLKLALEAKAEGPSDD